MVSVAPVDGSVAVTVLLTLNLPGSAFIAFSSGPLGLKNGPPGAPAGSGPATWALSLKPGPLTSWSRSRCSSPSRRRRS